MLSTHGPTAHAASLSSYLTYLTPWEPRESRWESYDHVLSRAYTLLKFRSKSTLPRGHRRSTLRWSWYSGAKSWPELLIWAYSPPMGVYRTAIVQGLSSAHGRERRRENKPAKEDVISVTLKDSVFACICSVLACIYLHSRIRCRQLRYTSSTLLIRVLPLRVTWDQGW